MHRRIAALDRSPGSAGPSAGPPVRAVGPRASPVRAAGVSVRFDILYVRPIDGRKRRWVRLILGADKILTWLPNFVLLLSLLFFFFLPPPHPPPSPSYTSLSIDRSKIFQTRCSVKWTNEQEWADVLWSVDAQWLADVQ